MKPMFNVEELSLLTKEEADLQRHYVKMLQGYASGKIDGVQIKNLNAGMSNIARMTQSRSAMALLKYNILKGDDGLEQKMIGSDK